MHVLLALIPLAALTLLALDAIRSTQGARARGQALSWGTFAWLAVPAVALAGVITLSALGLYRGDPVESVLLSLAALVAGAAALRRERLREGLDARLARLPLAPAASRALAVGVGLVACAVLAHLSLELPYNPLVALIGPRCLLIQLSLLLGLLSFLHLLLQRTGAGIVLGAALCSLVGIAQHFIASFKSAAILPNDVFALGTAAAVAGSYEYAIDGGCLLSLACVLLASAISCIVLARRPAPGREESTRREATRPGAVARVAANLGGAGLVAAALLAGVTVPSYFDDLGVGMEYWYSLDYYRAQGFLTTFVAVAQDLPIEEPEGYSDEAARALEESYAATYDETVGTSEERTAAEGQFTEGQPVVITIMNETFSDLSSLDGESWGYEGPTYYGTISDSLMGGGLAVSVLGGGTCNSEFEFLTGIPLAYVGDGKYPYSLYDLAGAPSLARQLSELGYATTAIHPNYASNWNRDVVYEALGFDRFVTIDDFEGAETYHSGVSDAATYDKVLELLEGDSGPQFIFDVTMQNHSGYDQGNVGDVDQYEVDGVSDYDNGRLSEYLACIDESDRALEEFMEALSELDRPVVLIFFGDHQPTLAGIVNDALYPEETDELAHSLRTYETTYFVWANYDVAGSDQSAERDFASPCYLAALALDAIGAPLTDYQKAQIVAREEMPALSLLGARLADVSWVALDDSDALPAAYDDLSLMAYLEFASKL